MNLILKVETKKDLRKFIFFTKKHYQEDLLFVPPIYHILTKELTKEVLITKKYTAILLIDANIVKGRLLYTTDDSKMKNTVVGYFSFFESINDLAVASSLFQYMESDLRLKGINYVEGTFSPYDPDTRRGILVEGFKTSPTIMTSYNHSYYGELIEQCGYAKALDTYSMDAIICEDTAKKLATLERYFLSRHQVQIDSINLKKINQDIEAIHKVLKEATIDMNYQEAPSIELIQAVAKNMKLFINPDLIKIAREKDTLEPVGFCVVLPDFNQVFKKSKGRLNPFILLRPKKYINTARGMMQYVVPKYQSTGLIAVMFKKVYDQFEELNIKTFEAGTMVEENQKAMASFLKFGGGITKRYRIYGKEL